jgi:hypothetical protein
MAPRDAAVRECPSYPEVLGRRQLVHLLSRNGDRLLNSAKTRSSTNAPSLAEQVCDSQVDFRTTRTRMRQVEPGQRRPVASVSSFRSPPWWDIAYTGLASDQKLLNGTNVIKHKKTSSWEREVREPRADVVMTPSHAWRRFPRREARAARMRPVVSRSCLFLTWARIEAERIDLTVPFALFSRCLMSSRRRSRILSMFRTLNQKSGPLDVSPSSGLRIWSASVIDACKAGA